MFYFSRKLLHNPVLGNLADDFSLFKEDGAAVSAGNADVGLARFARAVDCTAHHRHGQRQLAALQPLLHLPGQTDQVYSYSHQGQAIWGDYVYWYEGNAIQKSGELYDGSIAYVAVFDYTGKQVCPRTRVAACSDFPNMSTLLDSKDCYCEGEGIQIKQGSKFYVGIATHTSAASSNRLATILQYECAVK